MNIDITTNKKEDFEADFHRENYRMLLRSEAFHDIPAAAWRFDNAPVMTKQLAKAKEYAENCLLYTSPSPRD